LIQINKCSWTNYTNNKWKANKFKDQEDLSLFVLLQYQGHNQFLEVNLLHQCLRCLKFPKWQEWWEGINNNNFLSNSIKEVCLSIPTLWWWCTLQCSKLTMLSNKRNMLIRWLHSRSLITMRMLWSYLNRKVRLNSHLRLKSRRNLNINSRMNKNMRETHIMMKMNIVRRIMKILTIKWQWCSS